LWVTTTCGECPQHQGFTGLFTGRATPLDWLKTGGLIADRKTMKGLEKLTSIRLAEMLTQKGVVPPDVVTDALYIQNEHGETFVDVLVNSGQISEWDLARVVVESFQLPFIVAGNYEISNEAWAKIPKAELFQHLVVPMDVFGNILTVSMPTFTAAETLMSWESRYGVEIYPYVGLISENKKALTTEFTEFKDWCNTTAKAGGGSSKPKAESEEIPAAITTTSNKNGWANIFDDADAAVRNSIQKPEN
jgi:hypothetical protein